MISSIYAHPFEFITGNVIPLYTSTLILKKKMHFVTQATWFMMRFIETKDAHGGFEFPFSMFKIIPFNTGSAFHNFHHLKNVGNYATFTRIWDNLFGTCTVYNESIGESKKKN